MKRAMMVSVAGFAVACLISMVPQPARASDTPTQKVEPAAQRIVAMYFHRPQRCPTCLKMGSYTEEAVTTGFPKEIKGGTVALYFIDFQDEKNAALTKGYQITGPALIVARIDGKKVVEFKNLTEIWSKVRDKEEFIKYVQGNVSVYQKDTKTSAK